MDVISEDTAVLRLAPFTLPPVCAQNGIGHTHYGMAVRTHVLHLRDVTSVLHFAHLWLFNLVLITCNYNYRAGGIYIANDGRPPYNHMVAGTCTKYAISSAPSHGSGARRYIRRIMYCEAKLPAGNSCPNSVCWKLACWLVGPLRGMDFG
jgi:hypothetical protein